MTPAHAIGRMKHLLRRALHRTRALWRRSAAARSTAPPVERITGPVRRDDRMHWYV